MTDNSKLPPPGGPASSLAVAARQGRDRGRALLAAVLVLAGSAMAGLIAGLIWAAVAPRVLYQVYTLKPPTAYAVNPETSAFIAADGWYCVIALIGGGLIGLLGYLFAVRRYGALSMTAIVLGSLGAAYLTRWLGHELSGASGFNHVLATSKPGAFLHAPIMLGAQGALAFWPIAAGAVAGGIELARVLRERHQAAYDEFQPASQGEAGQPVAPGQAGPGQSVAPDPDAPGQVAASQSVEPGESVAPGQAAPEHVAAPGSAGSAPSAGPLRTNGPVAATGPTATPGQAATPGPGPAGRQGSGSMPSAPSAPPAPEWPKSPFLPQDSPSSDGRGEVR
ncbi:MAG TPA: hypothetical protein VGI58_06625 [Streptosporangiaceae bacterium]|jgi:hypothetical protein